jgi:hypothetical protein
MKLKYNTMHSRAGDPENTAHVGTCPFGWHLDVFGLRSSCQFKFVGMEKIKYVTILG